MTAMPEMVDGTHHDPSPSAIIEALAGVVERQLEAARTLDADTLSEATAQRQDLLFHLRLATQEARLANAGERLALDPEAQLNLRRISALDRRLQIVLETVTDTLGSVLNRGGSDTYGLNGRIRR
jgi:hypothetical protein